jgi:glycosyltransferase involved in cell wall biosynthesis
LTAPSLTVITPVLNGMSVLPQCVEALQASDLPREKWEFLVVDDGSSDDTAAWAAERADRVMSVEGGPLGPGFARNLAAKAASGDILVFIDADVCVAPDALRRFHDLFAGSEDIGAAFGAYDERPGSPDFLSQYRNLYHRYVHLQGAGDTETFWAGCGAVRRELFNELGGFDTVAYPKPQIEDIELGYRIRDAGFRIILDPLIQGTHLKRWTLSGMVRTDLFDRGVPWMRLLLGDGPGGAREATLNVGGAEKVKTGLMGVSSALVLTALVMLDLRWLVPAAVCLTLIVLMNLQVYAWFAGLRGWGFALRVIPMSLVYYLISGLAVATALVLHVINPGKGPTAPAPMDVAGNPQT